MNEKNFDNNNDEWRELLESLLGKQKADDLIAHMDSSGFDPSDLPNLNIDPRISKPELGMIVQNIKNLMNANSDPVNWDMVNDVSSMILKENPEKPITSHLSNLAISSLKTADLWLDSVTDIPPTAPNYQVWTRKEWIDNNLPHWKKLFEPVALNYSKSIADNIFSQLPQEDSQAKGFMVFSQEGQDIEEVINKAKNGDYSDGMNSDDAVMFSGSPKEVMGRMFATLFGMTVGGAFAKIAKNSFGSNDIGIKLTKEHVSALVVNNIDEFAQDINIPLQTVVQYFAIIECAYSRLFAYAPWLVANVENAVQEYARHIHIDLEAAQSMIQGGSFSMPSAQDLSISNLITLSASTEQQKARDNLEFLLAIIQGWVEEVTSNVVMAYIPQAMPIREMAQRHRISQNPTQYAFKELVDLELSPAKVRKARKLWNFILQNTDIQTRDNFWSHPDIAPTAVDIENVESFFERRKDQAEKDMEFDTDLQKLLDGTLGYAPGVEDQDPTD